MKQAAYTVCLTRLLAWPVPGFESYQTSLGSLPLLFHSALDRGPNNSLLSWEYLCWHPWTSHCTHRMRVLEKILRIRIN